MRRASWMISSKRDRCSFWLIASRTMLSRCSQVLDAALSGQQVERDQELAVGNGHGGETGRGAELRLQLGVELGSAAVHHDQARVEHRLDRRVAAGDPPAGPRAAGTAERLHQLVLVVVQPIDASSRDSEVGAEGHRHVLGDVADRAEDIGPLLDRVERALDLAK